MKGIALVLGVLHDGERHLAGELAAVARRHEGEHEVQHVATDLAAWSRQHVQRLGRAAGAYDLNLSEPSDASSSGFAAQPCGASAEPPDRAPEPGLLLLRDLRELHLAAAANSLHWEMLAQAAQAGGDERLLGLASSCHPRTLRQMRWTNTMIKTLSPQILTAL
ncbi:hypothetical protein [Streptomyces crystallinus]|uniref:Uncharacterized protein n=1 Tax=Streptomyces crystallinus TaxID=68191 RepID=A0ABN1FNN8_9ACTN